MQRRPEDEFRLAMSLSSSVDGMDNATALQLKARLAQDFRDRLSIGIPTNADEKGLRRLAAQSASRRCLGPC
jgi:hypothetical protein